MANPLVIWERGTLMCLSAKFWSLLTQVNSFTEGNCSQRPKDRRRKPRPQGGPDSALHCPARQQHLFVLYAAVTPPNRANTPSMTAASRWRGEGAHVATQSLLCEPHKSSSESEQHKAWNQQSDLQQVMISLVTRFPWNLSLKVNTPERKQLANDTLLSPGSSSPQWRRQLTPMSFNKDPDVGSGVFTILTEILASNSVDFNKQNVNKFT